ncbi:HAMP domain-containing sensor histidine kinase [Streptosporangium sp. NPDC051022]|uniref:sensor histidine kinase n=1 Tax=Streptosporangium sp. NPDC051022 TaxID=3155752 RepID=UPI00342C243F
MSRLSVRVRATLAATVIVAAALGVATAVLVGVLRGSLVESASNEATRRADAVANVLVATSGAVDTANKERKIQSVGRLFDPDIKIVEETSPDTFSKLVLTKRSSDSAARGKDGSTAPEPGAASGPGTAASEPEGTSKTPPKDFLKPALEAAPDTVPGTMSGTMSGTAPDTVSDTMFDTVPGIVSAPTPEAAYQSDEWAPAGSFTVVKMPVLTSGGALVVQARASLEPTRDALRSLQDLLLPGIPALLLLVAALTWLAVGRALAPVSAIRAEMADITASDLHRRVPVPRSRDEIARLAETMNRTLDRLELAVDRHKRFVADAAHELRSPLAVLRTRLELAPPEPLAAEALTDVDRIQKLTADLLLLARLDAGEPVCHEEVDLGQVAAEEAARSRPRSEIKVVLDVAVDAVVRGSAEQLRRLVANLVDNAVRHADSTVTVRLALDEGPGGGTAAVLDVRDDGPGIPAEHHAAVFDRFTRLDEARDRDAGGSGLGLAIARDIAVRHGGTLDLVTETPGAWFRARFPVI